MMNKLFIACLYFMVIGGLTLNGQDLTGDKIKTDNGDLIIQPILHGTLGFQWDGKIIYVDPYGGSDAFDGLPAPDVVLITDIHGDHLNEETLSVLDLSKAKVIAPQAVLDKISDQFKSKIEVLGNGEQTDVLGMSISAIPMYNLPESPDSRHTKGRGNGYIISVGGKTLYLSGDTEDIPEMRALTGIDVAFVCMNLPYTMDIIQAASAVLDFKPKIIYPYHYRGKGGLSDVGKFKELVNQGNDNIEVRLRSWYPQ